ncbi:MAG: hypothetical protein IIA75_10745 [Proteobacteria bacterium]|nr:hypothetical protein [Pseudomonadota bacterium]
MDAGRGEEVFRLFTDGDATLLVSDEILLKVTSTDDILSEFEAKSDVGTDEKGDHLLDSEVFLSASILEGNINLSNVSSLTNPQKFTPLYKLALNIADVLYNEDAAENTIFRSEDTLPAQDFLRKDFSDLDALTTNYASTFSSPAGFEDGGSYVSFLDFSNNLLAFNLADSNQFL